jgi:hypothetical protein
MSLSPQQQSTLNPNLMLADKSVNRYPNQFFDLSMQYMPPTIKELFRWCTFYYYNSPLMGAAIRKMSRYPITDLIIEDEHESVRELWDTIFNKNLKMKVRLLEVNLDHYVYGNCFVSLHLPFTRFLACKQCGYSAPTKQWEWKFGSNYNFLGKCPSCDKDGDLDVRDKPYKDVKAVRLLRWSPENIEIKHNEYTGKSIYLYTVPRKIRMAVQAGDKDIIEDMPMIVIQAIKEQKKIRMDPNNFLHLKNPTLAEQDQGWGKPLIIHVLKDMFYFYTLRRAQEAIALEHIVPFDVLYPMPNAQMDPYVHTNLGSWRSQIENIVKQHRKDPNFKAVIPIPIGFGRIGGDGKALLLGPEMQYITQTVVGGMGIPQEFLFGGLNWTGSSVSLRTLENDFIQNRSDLLDLVNWIKEKIRIWLTLPDVSSIRFADFRMADDIQRNQQLIGLNAQGKVSDQTMLTELGYDFEGEIKKLLEEVHIKNYMNDLLTKGQARSQGEAQLISMNFQSKMNELAAKAQEGAQKHLQSALEYDNTGQITALVQRLTGMQKPQAEAAIADMKMQIPEIAASVEQGYQSMLKQMEQAQQQQIANQATATMMVDPVAAAQQGIAGLAQLPEGMAPGQVGLQQQQTAIQQAAAENKKQPKVNMKPEPNQKPPRRQGGV